MNVNIIKSSRLRIFVRYVQLKKCYNYPMYGLFPIILISPKKSLSEVDNLEMSLLVRLHNVSIWEGLPDLNNFNLNWSAA